MTAPRETKELKRILIYQSCPGPSPTDSLALCIRMPDLFVADNTHKEGA